MGDADDLKSIGVQHQGSSVEIHGCSDPKVGAYRKQGREPVLNVGPTDTGIIPEKSALRLEEVGEWLARNGEAVYGTSASTFPYELEWGAVTVKGIRSSCMCTIAFGLRKNGIERCKKYG